jgi:hypothetical protein
MAARISSAYLRLRGEQQIAIKHDAGQQVVEVMHHTSRQAADRFPSLRLDQVVLGGSSAAVGLGDKQSVGWLAGGAGQTPYCPVGGGQSVHCVFSLEADAIARRLQQIPHQRLDGAVVLRRDQIVEPQRALAIQVGPQRLLEGGIHLDNHSLRVAASCGDGSVFEEGTEIHPSVPSSRML